MNPRKSKEDFACPILDDPERDPAHTGPTIKQRFFWWVDMRITLGNIITLAGMLVALGAAWQRIDSQIAAKAVQPNAALTQIAPDVAVMKEQIAEMRQQVYQTHEDVRIILRHILETERVASRRGN